MTPHTYAALALTILTLAIALPLRRECWAAWTRGEVER